MSIKILKSILASIKLAVFEVSFLFFEISKRRVSSRACKDEMGLPILVIIKFVSLRKVFYHELN